MKGFILSGSHQSNSKSLAVSNAIGGVLNEVGGEVIIHDLADGVLPMFSDENFDKESTTSKIWNDISAQLEESDYFIIVSPEWNGMLTGGIINFLQFLGKELAHKPVLLVSVSAGRGGAFPIAQLRSLGYKNAKYCMIPEHLIFRGVGEVITDSGEFQDTDSGKYMEKQTNYVTSLLLEYAKGLKSVRESGVVDNDNFAHGMS